ncbi:similar to Saccharomyces cerevisiae YLR024C UBR2 Cytoplasmic ubiquitin-protein ligase (E3) [Maudiozyma barnettii]|uniref:E3 ubiquitin-protein ligase n=1 Tax=Maudiozyma barnettii TaxID=61262 RepID=A0A8H2ZK43_9SACH|nr:putative ubiquitin-protein ligase UBR2 [Kazachstania barnettii]CAB4256593.1 similar to Saccharomyces cerevisiae YLR024C UBR2 Cytoplasmic ubiquitin-protein ligase (E3) [Kazachstania barnettii]CAD1785196.1 similar to Saccharomyces cerevisiae YLR024C UBR2 Cytoplasmic ubiquitin-protein ligase (E3) [Kazachstania barnettii]
MYENRKEPESLRDFLTHLPTYADNDYSEIVSYIVWKTVKLCLTTDNDKIDWRTIVNLLESQISHDSSYKDVLEGKNWKDLHRQDNTNNFHNGTMCNRQCLPAEIIYYCFTCTINPLYGICDACFDPNEHIDHEYSASVITRSEGRLCHCGNESIFHNPESAYKCKNKLNNKKNTRFSMASSDYFDPIMHVVFKDIIDYIIDVILSSNELKNTSFTGYHHTFPSEHSSQGNNKSSNIPHESSSNTDSIFNEILIETTESQNMVYESYASNMNINEIWTVQLDNEDNQVHIMDLASKISKVLNKSIGYGISICNTLLEYNFPVVLAQTSDYDKIKEIFEKFRDENIVVHIRRLHDVFKVNLMEDLVHFLYYLCTDINATYEMRYTLRSCMMDSWKPKIEHAELEYNQPLKTKINLFGGFLSPGPFSYTSSTSPVSSPDENISKEWFSPWNFEDCEDDYLVQIIQNYNADLSIAVSELAHSNICLFRGSRFQYLVAECFDNFSRVASLRMTKVFCTLFSLTDNARRYLTAQYFDIYLNVVYKAVASDPVGIKLAFMSLMSQYTFQDPVLSNLAIQSGFIERTLKFAFTLLAFNSEDLVTFLPISIYNKFKLPSETIKNRKTIICLKDLCTLVSANTIPRELLESSSIFNCMLDAILQFSNILPVRREISEHVEFENFDFSTYYFFFSSLLIMVDSYLRCISMISDKEFRYSIIKRFMKLTISNGFELLSTSRRLIDHQAAYEEGHVPKLSAVKEKVCNHVTDVVRFQVGIDSQSFLNPTSYLFKFILQWSQCGRYESVPKSITNYVDFHKFLDDEVQALYISEASLSTLVLVGQINVGFWVRNGTPITHQKRMYTKFNMRELTYMSDVFNVQFSMCMANPDDFMVTFLTRWGLKSWSNGTPMGDYPDDETTMAVVNECLLLLIQLFTEIKSLIVVSSVDNFERTLKSEIIHALAFNRCTYAQIMDNIPEHITKHSTFDKYLEKYAQFTPATGGAECGSFYLKDEYIQDLDPYYLGVSSSKRYEIEKSVRNYMKNKEKKDFVDTYVPVKEVHDILKDTPYYNLYAISSVNTFGIFLKSTLEHIKKCRYESLLPRVVHLIHLCVVNNLNDFMKVFWHEYEIIDTEFYHFHSIGSILYSLLLDDIFSNVHGKIREIFRVLSDKAPHIDVNGYLLEQTPSFNREILKSSKESRTSKEEEYLRKKKLAQARRDKILRKFSKQQMKFIEKNVAINTSLNNSTSNTQNSGCDISITPLCWEYPDDSCVFCKMEKNDDSFVYFSYQENNICDFGIDFSTPKYMTDMLQWEQKSCNKNDRDLKMKYIEQAPVLRICGHGSHIKCLGNHMKSAATVHTQTTKNVPNSYGFGLIYCPVCNSLMNSFLPKIVKFNNKSRESFWKNIDQHFDVFNLPSELMLTCRKACDIFVKLAGHDSTNNSFRSTYDIISNLLVNSISNLELRLRKYIIPGMDEKQLMNKIPNQCLVTFRLLSDLLTFTNSQIKDDIHPLIDFMEKIPFSNNGTYNNILSISNTIFVPNETLLNPTEQILDLIYAKMEEDIILLCRGMLMVDFYESVNDMEIPWNKVTLDAKNENELEDYIVSSTVLEQYLKFFNYTISDGSWDINKVSKCFYHLLKGTTTVFLRRIILLFHVHYSIDDEKIKIENKLRDFESAIHYLTHGELKTFGELLSNFLKNYVPLTTLNYDNTPEEERIEIFTKLERKHFPAISCGHLIKLPHNLSKFYTNAEYEANKIEKLLGGESVLCLLCGSTMCIQKPVSLHGYKIGECTNHLRNECESDSNYGLFLMMRTNMIYIAYGDRGTFYHSPYINRYGDTGEGLKYGTPVFLDDEKYEHLTNEIFMGNMIPHIVFRATDGNSDQGGWETL